MKRFDLVFFALVLFISCTNKIEYSSDFQTRQVRIDGKTPQWSAPLRFYDEKTGINYTITNDHNNLYLCCCISNELLQIKILRAGLEFAIDTLGKKSFPVRIKYPLGGDVKTEPMLNIDPKDNPGKNGREDHSDYKLKLIAEATEMELVGFKPPLGKIISLSDRNSNGILAAIDFDKRGNMYYEAVLPFSTFYKNNLTPYDSNKVFNYRIKINSPSDFNTGEHNYGGAHGGGMGGGRMGGGRMGGGEMSGGRMGGGIHGNGMHGGNRGNSYQGNPSMSGTSKTEIKLRLAYR
jgi:hypothetical protein